MLQRLWVSTIVLLSGKHPHYHLQRWRNYGRYCLGIVYVTELDRLTAVHDVRSEFFSKPYPASTLVQVAGLVHSDLLTEMSAVVVIPRHRFRRPA